MDNKAMIFDVCRNSVVDGPGIRTTVFFKGCNLDCKWCHNPEGKSARAQLMVYKNRCTDCGKCRTICKSGTKGCDLCGKCTLYCPNEARKVCGKTYTIERLVEEIEKDKVFYDVSGGGVTFSGGECMLYPEFLEEALKKCKEKGISTAIDTAGNVPFDSFRKVIPYTDIILYDVKCIDEKLHIEGTGRSNQLILDNLKKLAGEFSGKIIIRIPVIEGFNATDDEMKRVKDFIKQLGEFKVELLPYHDMGEEKSLALNQAFIKFSTPSNEKIKSFERLFN